MATKTDQDLKKQYYDLVTSDFRTCKEGFQEISKAYFVGSLSDMMDTLKNNFVSYMPREVFNLGELAGLRPELLKEKNIYYAASDETIDQGMESTQRCYFQEKVDTSKITLKILPGVTVGLQLVNSKMDIYVYGNSYLDLRASGDHKINIFLYGQATALLTNVNNSIPINVERNGTGNVHYREIEINS